MIRFIFEELTSQAKLDVIIHGLTLLWYCSVAMHHPHIQCHLQGWLTRTRIIFRWRVLFST